MPNRLLQAESIAIVGLEKNTGKTTFLNYLIEQNRAGQRRLALTSIGYDGEATDLVTKTAKPRIYVPAGTLVATARRLLGRCQVEKDIKLLSGISSALGEIVIFETLDDGFIELAGPGTIEQTKRLKQMIRSLDPEALLIVDGALSRLSSAGHGLAQKVVLCTGASLHPDQASVLDETLLAVSLLQLPVVKLTPDQAAALEGHDYVIAGSELRNGRFTGPLQISHMLQQVEASDDVLIIKGLITQEMLDELLSYGEIENIRLIAQDPTRIFVDRLTYDRLVRRGIILQVLGAAELALVVVNPSAPRGPGFGPDFLEQLQANVTVPVIDVRRQPWN